MSQCGRCKALQGAEAQVLRLQKDVREFVKLLKNAREDGGLTKVQCEIFDKLTARHEAVLAGQAEDTCSGHTGPRTAVAEVEHG
jgi:hypothetical protein